MGKAKKETLHSIHELGILIWVAGKCPPLAGVHTQPLPGINRLPLPFLTKVDWQRDGRQLQYSKMRACGSTPLASR